METYLLLRAARLVARISFHFWCVFTLGPVNASYGTTTMVPPYPFPSAPGGAKAVATNRFCPLATDSTAFLFASVPLMRWSCMKTAVIGSRSDSERMDLKVAYILWIEFIFLEIYRGPGCDSTSPSSCRHRIQVDARSIHTRIPWRGLRSSAWRVGPFLRLRFTGFAGGTAAGLGLWCRCCVMHGVGVAVAGHVCSARLAMGVVLCALPLGMLARAVARMGARGLRRTHPRWPPLRGACASLPPPGPCSACGPSSLGPCPCRSTCTHCGASRLSTSGSSRA